MSQQVLTSDWGQDSLTVGPEIPTTALRFILGRVHVMTPDEEVRSMIEKRIDKTTRKGEAVYSPEQREQAIAAALWLHHENRAEYIGVMSGRL